MFQKKNTEASLSEELPYWEFSDAPRQHLILNDGSLVSGIKLSLFDIECFDDNEVYQLTTRLRGVLNSISENTSVQFCLSVGSDFSEVIKNKQGGAWMTSFVEQNKDDNKRVLPVISIVYNFTKPTGEIPSLLTLDEVITFFHEFGHALHGLLSDVNFTTLAGTNVPTDFVELPSQIMENWAAEPEVLKSYAFHYVTGKPIPTSLIKKMDKSSKFGQDLPLSNILLHHS